MGMIPSSHGSKTCESHTVRCCVVVDAVGVAVCCCVLIVSGRVSTSALAQASSQDGTWPYMLYCTAQSSLPTAPHPGPPFPTSAVSTLGTGIPSQSATSICKSPAVQSHFAVATRACGTCSLHRLNQRRQWPMVSRGRWLCIASSISSARQAGPKRHVWLD